MIGCKCAIYLQIDFVLDHLQFKQPMGKTIHTSKQLKTIDQPNDRGQGTHPKAVGLQQSERLIYKQLDYNQLTGQLIKRLIKYEHKYKHPPWGQSWLEAWIRG